MCSGSEERVFGSESGGVPRKASWCFSNVAPRRASPSTGLWSQKRRSGNGPPEGSSAHVGKHWARGSGWVAGAQRRGRWWRMSPARVTLGTSLGAPLSQPYAVSVPLFALDVSSARMCHLPLPFSSSSSLLFQLSATFQGYLVCSFSSRSLLTLSGACHLPITEPQGCGFSRSPYIQLCALGDKPCGAAALP